MIVITFGLAGVSACTVKPVAPVEQAVVTVEVVGQERIRFSGKGAGAGMMMPASMGAMGIAIGVAIDEGIAKDIHQSFIASGNDLAELVKTETNAWLSSVCAQKKTDLDGLCHSDSRLTVRLLRYGFVTTSGNGDPVKPELEIGFVLGSQEERRLSLKDADDPLKTAELEAIKTEGAASAALLQNGYQILLEMYQKRL